MLHLDDFVVDIVHLPLQVVLAIGHHLLHLPSQAIRNLLVLVLIETLHLGLDHAMLILKARDPCIPLLRKHLVFSGPIVQETIEILAVFLAFLLVFLRLVLDFVSNAAQLIFQIQANLGQFPRVLLDGFVVGVQDAVEGRRELAEFLGVDRNLEEGGDCLTFHSSN